MNKKAFVQLIGIVMGVSAIALASAAYLVATKELQVRNTQNQRQIKTPSVVNDADWQTYRYENIEMKYPSEDCVVDNSPRNSSFLSVIRCGEGNINFTTFYASEEHSNLFEAVRERWSVVGEKNVEVLDITWSGRPAVQSRKGSAAFVAFWVDEESYVWMTFTTKEALTAYVDKAKIAKQIETVNQILSTFKFIEPDTSSWKTYRDEKFGFEFRYPSDWKHHENSMQFGSPDFSAGLFKVGISTTGLSLEEYLRNSDESSKTAYEGGPSSIVLSSENATIGKNAVSGIRRDVELLGAGFRTPITYARDGNMSVVYVLSMSPGTKGFLSTSDFNNYDGILSTFKFSE